MCIYHSLENARVYHGRELQFIDITAEVSAHTSLVRVTLAKEYNVSMNENV